MQIIMKIRVNKSTNKSQGRKKKNKKKKEKNVPSHRVVCKQ